MLFINKNFQFKFSKKKFYPKLQTFCFKNQDEIFFLFCVLYFTFLVLILDVALATIIFFWCGIIFVVIYGLKILKVPTLQLLIVAVLLTKVYWFLKWLHECEGLKIPVCIAVIILLFLGVLYFYLSHTLFFF